MFPLFVLPFTLLVMLASSTCCDHYLFFSFVVQTTIPSGFGAIGGGW
jgi:hypothetical protein